MLRDETAKRGMQFQFLGPNPPTIAGGAAASANVLDGVPTAVVVLSDLMAIGFTRGLADMGIRVPQEVSVVGFDDVPVARLVVPRITTIGSSLAPTGAQAMHSLASLIEGNPVNTEQTYSVPTRLVIRESTGPARDARTVKLSRAPRGYGWRQHRG